MTHKTRQIEGIFRRSLRCRVRDVVDDRAEQTSSRKERLISVDDERKSSHCSTRRPITDRRNKGKERESTRPTRREIASKRRDLQKSIEQLWAAPWLLRFVDVVCWLFSNRRIFLEHFRCNTKTPRKPLIHSTTSIRTTVNTSFSLPCGLFDRRLGYLRHHLLGGHYTLANIHDNTLFFHVESNFGVRRSDFTRRLADQIGFLAVPKPDIDRMHFMNETGRVNTRVLHNDYCLPRDYLPKPEEWHLNPNPSASLRLLRPLLQTMTYQLRMGLSHMFSTGQLASFQFAILHRPLSRTRHRHRSILLEFLRHSEHPAWFRFC